jgi:peroxiredoxin (alkyl hydroperoxide reductase subunit C)
MTDQITFCEIGKPAPDFRASAFVNGKIEKEISLDDYQGKWVLLFFYPLDFTFVCPTELIELGELSSEFEKEDCQILGVSVDSVYSHQNWAKADERIANLGFPLLSDLNKEIAFNYNVLHDDGMAFRGSFLIDPEGILQSMMINNLAVGRNAKELLRTLCAFKDFSN